MIIVSALFLSLSAVVAQPADAPLTVSKSADSFSECFARTQDEGGQPWAFVPTQSGGTFSNGGGRGAGAPYRLFVRAAGGGTAVRLVADRPSPNLVRAVERCR